MIPRDATRIAEARKNGLRPADMILISQVGPQYGELNPIVCVNHHRDYDWWWLKGLDVALFTDEDHEWRNHAEAILMCRPHLLCIWDVKRLQGAFAYRLPRLEDIERPMALWRWELSFIPWLPSQNMEFHDA